ncbi:MAG: hypothetical protein EOP50_12420 [Sphingobacteriales bacterium]|nr:MAG: hypothetical protein EOP50_12420 [Sphingobacteriales bacterium]
MHPDLLSLQKAAEGLYIISETDAALEAFSIATDVPIDDALRQLCAEPPDVAVEIREAFPFLENQQRMHNEGPDGARFQALCTSLQQTLTGLQLYRLGDISIHAFLLGTLSDGTRGGLRTRLVET